MHPFIQTTTTMNNQSIHTEIMTSLLDLHTTIEKCRSNIKLTDYMSHATGETYERTVCVAPDIMEYRTTELIELCLPSRVLSCYTVDDLPF